MEPKLQPQISDVTSESVDFDQLQAELNEALLKAEENLSGWKRAQADMENYRRRKETEGAELVQFGKQAAFVKILPILDSLDQALFFAPQPAAGPESEKYANWKKGLQGIVKQLHDTLAEMGIQKIEAVGQKFDPNKHEAVKEVQGEADQQDGIIAEQYQTGYALNGDTLRPAQVAVVKKTVDLQ